MAHHMAGKFTIHDLRPNRLYTDLLPTHFPTALNHAQALTAAEGLAEKGLRPRVDFAVVEWEAHAIIKETVLPLSAGPIHERAEAIWTEWKAKQPKPKKYVVELWAGVDQSGSFPPVYCRFGWLIVRGSPTDLETRVAFTRVEATVFDAVTPAQTDAWYKDLGSPSHVHLCPREVA